jgi:hypothetical protein
MFNDSHTVEITSSSPTSVNMLVSTASSGALLAEFILAKNPADDPNVVAQAAYDRIFGAAQ